MKKKWIWKLMKIMDENPWLDDADIFPWMEQSVLDDEYPWWESGLELPKKYAGTFGYPMDDEPIFPWDDEPDFLWDIPDMDFGFYSPKKYKKMFKRAFSDEFIPPIGYERFFDPLQGKPGGKKADRFGNKELQPGIANIEICSFETEEFPHNPFQTAEDRTLDEPVLVVETIGNVNADAPAMLMEDTPVAAVITVEATNIEPPVPPVKPVVAQIKAEAAEKAAQPAVKTGNAKKAAAQVKAEAVKKAASAEKKSEAAKKPATAAAKNTAAKKPPVKKSKPKTSPKKPK